jgi:eukaryotic-like serine/threonine-protein kinase
VDDFEFIVEVAKGPLGHVWLARVLSGAEQGRMVAVRCVPLALIDPNQVAAIVEAVGVACRARHPAIAKVLDVKVAQNELRVVGEYVEGEYLSALRTLLFRLRRPLPRPVSQRIIVGALRAADHARRDLTRLGLPVETRLLFADTVIVANFGETLITDPIVASRIEGACFSDPELHGAPLEPPECNAGRGTHEVERAEVFFCAVLLLELLVNRPLCSPEQVESALAELDSGSDDSTDPSATSCPALVATLSRALESEPARRFAGLAEFSDALVAFGGEMASENQVQTALEEAARTRLESRRRLLEGADCESAGLGRAPSSRPTNRPKASDPVRFSPEAPTSSKKMRAFGALGASQALSVPPSEASPAAGEFDSGAWPLPAESAALRRLDDAAVADTAAPSAKRVKARSRRVFGAGLGVLLLGVAVASRVRGAGSKLRPDPSVTVQAPPPPSVALTQDQPALAAVIPPAMPAPPAASAEPTRTSARSVPRRSTESPPHSESDVTADALPKPAQHSPFHPHNIAPYRPRGI